MRAPVRMCARCNTITDQPVKVREVHSDCGPGWAVYACQQCAPHYPPQTDPAELPLNTIRRPHHHRQDSDSETDR